MRCTRALLSSARCRGAPLRVRGSSIRCLTEHEKASNTFASGFGPVLLVSFPQTLRNAEVQLATELGLLEAFI